MSADESSKNCVLAVDIGNSSIDAAIFNNCREETALWKTGAEARIPPDEADSLARVFADGGFAVPQAAVIGSVAGGGLAGKVSAAIKSVFGLKPLVADCGMETGLGMGYETPETLGIDRLANAAALFSVVKNPCIAVDLGTAATFDCVSPEGVYLGGAIAPGLESFRRSLSAGAAALPETELRFPPSVLASNTADCVKSGTMFGYAKMVDGMVRSLSAEMKTTPRVVATGGFAGLVSGACETFSETDKFLTLKGLVIILLKNEKLLPLQKRD